MTEPAVPSAIVVDCSDPSRVAAFWQRMLGGRRVSYPELGVEALRAPGVTFDFVASPDTKRTKNRWHLDLATDDAEATMMTAMAEGATLAADFDRSDGFVVMRDPENNEFCILRNSPAGAPWAPPPQAPQATP
ncbi:MAG: VOC family protein [Acidimicrobiia bacterium]|nr:VOC family protein [Acidimicrobiia bacterium]